MPCIPDHSSSRSLIRFKLAGLSLLLLFIVAAAGAYWPTTGPYSKGGKQSWKPKTHQKGRKPVVTGPPALPNMGPPAGIVTAVAASHTAPEDEEEKDTGEC